MKNRIIHKLLACCLLASAFCLPAFAQGTAFTYQGRLNDGAALANGNYDLRFAIFDASGGGTQQGGLLTNSATAVSNGLFTVTLDFGNQFPGNDRWLEIAVRTNGGGAFSLLAPRQALTATPYAIYSSGAATAITATSASSVAAGNISGTLTPAQLPATVITNGANGVTLNGSFTGNGAGVTNVPLTTLNGEGALKFLFGEFPLVASPTVGVSPASVVMADVNSDGRLDLISANSATNTLTVLTNNGSGGFLLSVTPVVGANPKTVLAADVNGDGKPDLISANAGPDTLSVLTNNGSGGFVLASSPSPGSGVVAATTADVNGDNKVDLIAATSPSLLASGHLVIFTNSGNGGFVLASSPSVGGGVGDSLNGVTAADVNGDGKADLIAAQGELGLPGRLTIVTNNGSGSFVSSSSLSVGAALTAATSVAAGDVNGDGSADLISAISGGTLVILTNNGTGGFATNATLTVGSNPRSVVAADFNGDGKPDLVSANFGSDTLSILTNNGGGGFAPAATLVVGDGPQAVAVGDLDGHGRVDLVSANQNTNTLSVFFNLPSAQFNSPVSVAGAVTAGSFTGDGAGVTNLNAAQIASGTLADARLSANVALLNAHQFFTGSNRFSGVLTATNVNSTFAGNGAGLTNLNASQLASGTVAEARLGANVALLNANQSFTGTNAFTGRVGIGTNNPASKLHVNGTVTVENGQLLADLGSASQVSYGFIGDPNTGIFEPGLNSNVVAIATAGVERMRVNSSGNVGIGAQNPVSQLHVNGATVLQGGLVPTSTTVTNLLNLAVGNTADGNANGISFYESASGAAMSLGYDGTIAGTANNALRIYTGTGSNIFTFEHGGALGIGVVDVAAGNSIQHFSGAVLTTGGTWVNASDRNAKENFAPVDVQEVLARVAALPLTRWNYKAEGADIRHVGPMAQDFRAAFDLGLNDRSIATVDADGVALAAIQGLNQKLEEQKAENAELKKELSEIKRMLLNRPNQKE